MSDKTAAYNENEGLLQGYYKNISGYQEAQSLIMQGKTDEAIALLNRKNSGFYDSAKIVGEATEEEKKRLEDLAIATGVNAVLMRERYEAGVEGVTEAMVKTAEEAAETAKTEFEKIGGQIGDGIGEGAEDKKPGLLTKIRNIVAAMKAAAEDEAQIKSPSRLFRDDVGKMIVEGIAVGVEQSKESPLKAVRNVIEGMRDSAEDGQKEIVNSAKDFTETIASVLEDAAEEEKDAVIAHAKEMKRINKKHNDDLWEENHQHDLKMQKLKEEHLEDIKRINENLDSVNADYVKADKEHAEKIADLNKKKGVTLEDYTKENERYAEKLADLDKRKLSITNDYVKADKDLHEKEQSQIEKHNEAVKNLMNKERLTCKRNMRQNRT